MLIPRMDIGYFPTIDLLRIYYNRCPKRNNSSTMDLKDTFQMGGKAKLLL